MERGKLLEKMGLRRKLFEEYRRQINTPAGKPVKGTNSPPDTYGASSNFAQAVRSSQENDLRTAGNNIWQS